METLKITVNGNNYEVTVESTKGNSINLIKTKSKSNEDDFKSSSNDLNYKEKNKNENGEEISPLAGIIQAVHVIVGQSVNKGDLIVTLESMKMYTPINAHSSGEIDKIHVKVGDSVDEGSCLYNIK